VTVRAIAGGAIAIAGLAAAIGCAPLNYTHPTEPNLVRCCVPPPAASDSLLVVSYNIRFAREVPGALAILEGTPELAAPDVVLLQEMDAVGTRRIANALGMNVVYYPAVHHPQSHHDSGNAILTRWPVLRHRKLILPHRGRLGHTQRIGVLAVLAVGGREVTVASIHLATPVENSPGQRHDQVDAIVDLVAPADMAVVGGDMNDPWLARRFVQHGFACPTRGHGATNVHGLALDQVLVHRRTGSVAGDSLAERADALAPAGVVPGDGFVSDHWPIWTRIALRVEGEKASP